MGKTVVTSISLDSDFLSQIDDYAKKMGYSSRSEVIRDSLRRLLEEQRIISSSQTVLAAIIALYNDNIKNITNKLSYIRHSFDDIIISSLHMHIIIGYCSEFILARGASKKINELIVNIRRIKGIDSLSFAIVPLEENNI